MIWWAILLFLGGVILIMAEFIVPGGICGTFGAIMLLGSTVLGGYYYPDYLIFIIIFEFLGFVGALVAGFYLLTKSSTAQKLVMGESQTIDKGYVSIQFDPSLVGKRGKVISALRPAGIIEVDGKRVDAVSSGMFIDAGTMVRIIDIQGPRIVVEEDKGVKDTDI
jgi:membrane-bound serine protease (ClpP class)